jgi:hypothetical protein
MILQGRDDWRWRDCRAWGRGLSGCQAQHNRGGPSRTDAGELGKGWPSVAEADMSALPLNAA